MAARVLMKLTMLEVSETLEELESADSSAVIRLNTLEQVIHLYSCHLSITLTSIRHSLNLAIAKLILQIC